MSTGFEQRLLEALTEIDAQWPVAGSTAPGARRKPASVAPRRWFRRPVVLVGVVAAVVAAGGATAAARMIWEPKEFIGSAETIKAGDETRLKGWGCQPGSTVTVLLDGTAIGTATAEVSSPEPVVGWFTADVVIPADTAPGEHTLATSCPAPEGGLHVLDKPITVTP